MKRLTKYLYLTTGIAVLLAGTGGCRRNGLGGGGTGTLSFVVERNDELTPKSTAAAATAAAESDDIPYRIDVVDEAGDTVAHYDDHREISTIKLAQGVYDVYATDNLPDDPDNRFGRPRYRAHQSVTVQSGRVSQVILICRLQNVKVQVDFDRTVQERLLNYKLCIQPDEGASEAEILVFDQAAVDAGQNTGWVQQTENGRFLLRFFASNEQEPDRLLEYRRVIADAEPGDFYRFNVRIDENGSASSGGTIFRLKVRTDLAEYDFPLAVMEPTRALPVVVRDDEGSIGDPVSTNEDNRDGNGKLRIVAEAGFERIRIRHEDPDVLLKYGLPGMVTLGGDNSASEDEQQRERLAGVIAWGAGSDDRACVVGETEAWIDFSDLLNVREVDGEKLPGTPGRYEVDIEIYDADRQMRTQRIVLAVVRDFATGTALATSLVNGVPGVGAAYAYVSASWMNVRPEGLAFEYRKVQLAGGDEAWQKVMVDEAFVNRRTKTFIGLLNGLEPETAYEFRPVGDGVDPGSVETFVTEPYVEVPNLDFEGGSYGTFDGASGVYDPNIPGQERFWATGNPGGMFTMMGQGLKKNVTLPVTDEKAHTGTALWLTSYYISQFGVSSLASGSLFSGTFGPISSAPTNTNAQRALVHYGQPYTARPLALKGWYKYLPELINRDIDNKFPELKGQEDQCKIYVSLEVWGTGVTSRPGSPTVVGAGELRSGATPTDTPEALANNGYVSFEIRIEYAEELLGMRPDHIVMGATCSYLSDDFCGGEGSTLYIDDFELVWDPTQLAERQ